MTSRNSPPRAVITGVAIASRHFWFILTGPGTRKQSPVCSAMVNAMLASYSINVRKRLTDRGRVRPPYMVRIGIAMLQGARHEHCEAIQNAAMEMNVEIEVVELRKQSQVDSSIHGLILPGGESTTMRIASQSESLLDGIFDWITPTVSSFKVAIFWQRIDSSMNLGALMKIPVKKSSELFAA